MPLGSTRPRVAHAHPLTPDARASRIAVAFRDAERRERRLGRTRRSRRRFAIPATGLLAVAAAVFLASQPLAPAPLAATSTGDRSGMAGGAGHALASSPSATTPALTSGPPLVAGPAGRPEIDDAVTPGTPYRWPLEHARITQDFGPASGGLFVVNGQRFHDGLDIANFCGAPILAAHDGTVIAASRHVVAALGWVGGTNAYDAWNTSKGLWGTQARVIVIDDGNGFRSVYIHLHRIDVTVGETVKAGQQIGLEGSSGHATGCHLHYAIYSPTDPGIWRTNSKDVDRYHLPTGEIAHIDPLTFLPPLRDGWITWGWGAQPQD